MNVSTSGTGAVNVAPRTIAGEDIWSSDLTDPINTLFQPHILFLEKVQEFLVWFIGDDNSTLATSTDMIIKAIDPNKTGNVGLCNHQKIRMRQYSSVVNLIIKNHLIRSSYTSKNPKKYLFTYKYEVSGREVYC